MMKNFSICGIQQIGIGVKELFPSWKWYIEHFGMDCRIFEDDSEARLMLPYTGGQPRTRHAVLAVNLQGGGGFEVWQYKGREPQVKTEPVRLGDLGILACKIKVKNTEDALTFFKGKNIELPGKPAADPSGNKTFFLKDPWGNLFQAIEAKTWFLDEGKTTGGAHGAMIGVSDIEKARNVYSDILGYDQVVYDKTGTFPDLAEVPGGDKELRRVLLACREPFRGPFSRLFGESVIELISAPGCPGERTYKGRFWGDPGFIHLCFDMHGMEKLREYCHIRGFPFTVDSMDSRMGDSFDMGEAAGHFAYIEDPDGTLIEFVETHKVPLLKKLGWYLDLRKRDPQKALPGWMLRTLRFSKVKM